MKFVRIVEENISDIMRVYTDKGIKSDSDFGNHE